MKKTIKIIAFTAISAFTLSACNDDDDETVISADNLPAAAKSFLSTYFTNESVVKVEKNAPGEADGTLYEVDLTNGYEVDFTEQGNWTDVSQDDDTKTIPIGFIPEKIVQYISTNYPNAGINSIDTEINIYEVELNNQLDLFFDLEGNFLRIDP